MVTGRLPSRVRPAALTKITSALAAGAGPRHQNAPRVVGERGARPRRSLSRATRGTPASRSCMTRHRGVGRERSRPGHHRPDQPARHRRRAGWAAASAAPRCTPPARPSTPKNSPDDLPPAPLLPRSPAPPQRLPAGQHQVRIPIPVRVAGRGRERAPARRGRWASRKSGRGVTGTSQAASRRATNRCGVPPSCSTLTSGRASSIGSSKVRYEVSDGGHVAPTGAPPARWAQPLLCPASMPPGPPQ